MQVEFNGVVYEFPDDATDQEIAASLGQKQPQQQEMPAFTGGEEFGITPENVDTGDIKQSGFGRGLEDPVVAAMQMFGGEELRKKLAEREQQYQQERAAKGESGFELSRLAGQVLSPAGIIPGVQAAKGLSAFGASKIGQAIPGVSAATGKLGQAAAAGAVGGLTQPVEQSDLGNYWKEKAEQAGFGGAAGVGGYLIGKAVTPRIKEGVDELLAQNVPVTPGQAYEGIPGWFFRQIESFDIPFLRVNKEAVNRQFTKAVGNDVLSSLGKTVPKDANTGEDVFRVVHNTIKQAYDDATNAIPKVNADPLKTAVQQGIDTTKAQLSTTRQAKAFDNIITSNVFKRIQDGQIDGKELKAIESFIRKKRAAVKGIDLDSDVLRTGYDEILKTVKGFIQTNDPTGNIAKANAAYLKRARLKSAVEKSLTEQPGQRGTITPKRLLQESARQAEGSQAALGTAPLQQQATRAFDVLGDTAENATKYRNLLIAGKLTGLGIYGLFQPGIAIPLLVTSGLSYDVAKGLLNSPSLRGALNQAIEKIGPQAASKIVNQYSGEQPEGSLNIQMETGPGAQQ